MLLRLLWAATTAGVLVCAAPTANAFEVYLNGVRVTGLKNQTFTKCKVVFDSAGNLYVTAPGYTVKQVADASRAKSSTTPLTRRYYLVSAGNSPEKVQYEVDVFINGKWLRKIRSAEPQVMQEVTSQLRRGKNQVRLVAVKKYGNKPRLSTSRDHHLRIVVGVGERAGETVNVTRAHVDFRAGAERQDNFSASYTLKAK